MTAHWHRRLRLARDALLYLVAGVLVLMALAAGAMSQLLPFAERHPDRIARWLGERAGREVAFDRVETQWTRRGPLLRLDGLRVGGVRGAGGIAFGDAEVLVSQYAGLLPGRSFTELRLRNLALTLRRDATGLWSVQGLPGQAQSGGDPLAQLEGLGELQLVGARLGIDAPGIGVVATLPRVDLRLRVDGTRLRAGLRARMQPGGAPIDAVLDMDRRRGNGRAWLSGRRIDLAQWAALARHAGIQVDGGTGDVQAWAGLRAHRVASVVSELSFARIGLHAADAPARRVDLADVAGKARWARTAEGWRLDVPTLRVGNGAQAQRIERLALAGGRTQALAADRVDAAPLFAVAALSDRLQPGVRRWLSDAAPAASVSDLAFAQRDGRSHAKASIRALAFRPAGTAPGLSGVSGTLEGDGQGMRFAFDPAETAVFTWPHEYNVPHPLKLRGDVLGWREGAGWRVGTTALRINGEGYGADVRGGLWFQGDGTRPWIDLAADLDDTSVLVAKKFWMRHSMSPATVRWLDAALVSGSVRDGRAVVTGDLDDWPFRNRDGRFEARARIVGTTVKFQPDWPAVQALDADVAFIADGFDVRGKGQVAGVDVPRIEAGIAHFGEATLRVDAAGRGDAARMLALLRDSPLRKTYADTLENLDARGPATATYRLEQPLHGNARRARMEGGVALSGVRLADKRWDLAFDDVRGTARYGGNGFAAEGLAVRHETQPGRLSLRAGDRTLAQGNAFEGELAATLRATDLLARAPDLAWLQPHVQGASPWTIAVALPKGNAAGPSRLQLRSSLAGTTLALPAPLDKPAGQSLATVVDIDVPIGKGDVQVAFGNRLALRARDVGGRTGIRVALGSTRVDTAPNTPGLVANGRTDRLDPIGWATLANSSAPAASGARTTQGTNAGASGFALRDVDVTADRLQMIGSEFPSTRLRAVPADAGTAVRFEGTALAGALLVPRADGATVSGRMQRLYWRAPRAAPGTAQGGAKPPDAGDDTDPRKVPPLNLVVDELRFGDARMGSATLRTQPTPTGLRVVELKTRAPGQAIDVSGDWTGVGAAAATRLQAQLRSEDFGALLAGFGMGKQVAKGKGEVRMDAGWAGSPAAFGLASLEGTLRIDARDGQLVEIEPGAGRVLGLLSLAQLPRRLTLDFRDFFDKGFAFDHVEGAIRFARGIARSDDLRIHGPAAQIRIHGLADLRAQTYDQTIEVYPRAGNLLTVAGAIAGGPVGAAIGAAANAVLNRPLGQLAARTYRVTGPWKSPKVETLGRNDAAAAPNAPPPG